MKRWWLLLFATAVVPWSAAGSGVERALDKPFLPARPNAALAGIKKLVVVADACEPNGTGLDWQAVATTASERLKREGLDCVVAGGGGGEDASSGGAELRIHGEVLKLPEQGYVVRVQTSAGRVVLLPGRGEAQFLGRLWFSKPLFKVVGRSELEETVEGAVCRQVDAFAQCWRLGNAAAGDIEGKAVGKQVNPSANRFDYKYVASRNSKVFHKAGCPLAARIKPKNMVGFRSRQEAVRSGRRPCKLCKP